MKRIAITRTDGGLSIMHTNGDPEEEVKKWAGASSLKAVSWREIQDADVPADHTYFAAFVDDGTRIVHDMAKARVVHRNLLRVMRMAKLSALDVAFMRAVEKADAKEQASIASQKQALRDVTADPAIDAAGSVEELKASIPSILR